MHFTLEAPNMHRMMHELCIEVLGDVWASKAEANRIQLYPIFGDGYRREYLDQVNCRVVRILISIGTNLTHWLFVRVVIQIRALRRFKDEKR
jgi:hypothetical protein